ncbi:MarR family winged helix-turn-helix transcriptional regulator [Bifidobacterium choloepi]|uniref:MarR family transcriptional regulator n=1 Tax=Bifidobacterium choloepi TaxID=2614131 RepID=A0A6I5NHZ0_9BIFI|nr:MarR family transcriptional regulator [Bifidobacterium choloepi]NEG69953.1 MarR family transcriptional regulator [Bifidobacterium choloepi]
MDSVHYQLMAAHLTLMRRVNDVTRKLGLTPGQPKVIEFLNAHGEADQSQIAAGCLIEKATIGGILARMEQAGLISRRRSDADRRAILVSLTDRGRELAVDVHAAFEESERPIREALTDQQIAELDSLLTRLRAALANAD